MTSQNLPFVFVGNNIAIDFINTEIFSHGQLVDLLKESADLRLWLESAHLEVKSKMGPADFESAQKLRSALKAIYMTKINDNPPPPKQMTIVNQHLANHSTQQLLRFYNKEYTLQPAHDGFTIPKLLAYLAYEGSTLLASAESARLKKCSNPECVLIFLDTSRNQKRRWCSMDVCGNRSKVSRHYRKSQS